MASLYGDGQKCLVILPQSMMRFWGIHGVTNSEFFQVELPIRYKNDLLFAESYYKINKMLLNTIGIFEINKIKLNNPELVTKPNVLIDSHILNLSYHFFGYQQITSPSVVSYASDGLNSLLASDLKFGKDFLRGVVRSLRLRKKFHPRLIWHWDDFAKIQSKYILNFGWQHKFIESESIATNSRIFMQSYLREFPEISDFEFNKPVLIVYPQVHKKLDFFVESIKALYASNIQFRSIIEKCDQILVKQHKFCTSEYPDNVSIFSRRFRVAKSPITRALPIEILYLGFPNSSILSVPSSCIFSNTLPIEKIIWNADKKDLRIGYELMLKRFDYN
jgi:hypothetical protein